MTYLLPCYKHVIPVLKRECGAKRCGPYNIDNTVIGKFNSTYFFIFLNELKSYENIFQKKFL